MQQELSVATTTVIELPPEAVITAVRVGSLSTAAKKNVSMYSPVAGTTMWLNRSAPVPSLPPQLPMSLTSRPADAPG